MATWVTGGLPACWARWAWFQQPGTSTPPTSLLFARFRLSWNVMWWRTARLVTDGSAHFGLQKCSSKSSEWRHGHYIHIWYSLCPGCSNHSSRGRLIQNKPLQAEPLNSLGEDTCEFSVQTGCVVTWLAIQRGGVLHGVHSILQIRSCQWHCVIGNILCWTPKKGPTCSHLMRDAGPWAH